MVAGELAPIKRNSFAIVGYMNVAIVAKSIVQDSDNRILILKRSLTDDIRPGSWDLPGGGVEEGEDPTAAVIREIQEEAGIEVQNVSPVFVCAQNDTKYRITIVYRASYVHGEIALSFEHDEYTWISPKEFLEIDIPEKYKQATRKL